MSYKVYMNTLDNPTAQGVYDELTENGHDVVTGSDGNVGDIDLLILSIPHANRDHMTIRDLDADLLQEKLAGYVNDILLTSLSIIPLMEKSSLKRIAFLTDPAGSIRESDEFDDYAYHMAQAAAGMVMKILHNSYRRNGFSFRVYADCGSGIGATEYILTDQSYIPEDDPVHSDENRIVCRDGYLREISW
ncbi:MAG: hypothetical protein K6D96_08045 [Acetatifactor sp.]|nr:hypothetical protein [Acetatifactor sp.]